MDVSVGYTVFAQLVLCICVLEIFISQSTASIERLYHLIDLRIKRDYNDFLSLVTSLKILYMSE